MQFIQLNSNIYQTINIRSQISLEKEEQKNSHYTLIIASYFLLSLQMINKAVI